ncbi:MAG: hypothetical protein K1X47_10060 [Cyclobacteriaceae bacterium]|nr:hypothetical protein [Cyclobacteriaceae bacterium]
MTRSILVAAAYSDLSHIIKDVLQIEGYEVLQCTGCTEAASILSAHKVDAMVLGSEQCLNNAALGLLSHEGWFRQLPVIIVSSVTSQLFVTTGGNIQDLRPAESNRLAEVVRHSLLVEESIQVVESDTTHRNQVLA